MSAPSLLISINELLISIIELLISIIELLISINELLISINKDVGAIFIDIYKLIIDINKDGDGHSTQRVLPLKELLNTILEIGQIDMKSSEVQFIMPIIIYYFRLTSL